MRTDRLMQMGGLALLTSLILSCSYLGASSMPSAAPATQTAERTAVAPTSTVTTEPSVPTEVSPTTIQGPVIARLTPSRGFDLGYVHMLDAKQGWGTGGLSQAQDHVFRTQTGGQTWSDVTPPQPIPNDGTALAALGFFQDSSHAWVAYGPANPGPAPDGIRVWFTDNGGSTWSYGVVDATGVSAEVFLPLYLDFPDSEHGRLLVLLGGGMNHAYSAVFATDDGGKTWRDILDPSTDNDIQSFEKTGMFFEDAQTGWLTRDAQGVDSTPHIIETKDGGVSWRRIDLPAPSTTSNWFDDHACGTYAPIAFSTQAVLVLAKCVDTATFKLEQDYLYSTSDSGQTWQSAAMPSGFTVADPPAGGLFFTTNQTGMALGRRIYRTDDGGTTWSSGKQVDWEGQFSFVDLNTGWAVARNAGQIAFVRTSDGGQSWQEIHPVVGP